jgi:hypothetical protein
VTLPKQEWKRKEAPRSSMAEAATGGQITAPGGSTASDSGPGSRMAPLGGQTAQTQEEHNPITDQAIGATDGPTATEDGPTMGPGGLTASSFRTGASSGVDGTSSPATMEEDTDDDLLDYEPSPARNDMEINVVYLSSTNYSLHEEEDISQLALVSQDAIFKKPTKSKDHLKLLYIRGHLDGTLVARTLVDGGAALHIMAYATFKKLRKTDVELVKRNITFTGIGGEGPIGPNGVALMELTVGSKMIPTAFFVAVVQGNHNAICDWIHANCCVPSTLHQFLIQWVGEEVEIVHADVSACIAMVDSPSWSHYNINCLSSQDISDYDFISVSKDGFIPVSVKPVDDRLNLIM